MNDGTVGKRTELTPEQVHRQAVERDLGPRYADGRPKYHRHFADYAVHTDEECEQPFGRRRVYVFDTEDLEAHEAFITDRVRAEQETTAGRVS